MSKDGKYIRFEKHAGGIYTVVAKKDGFVLGEIEWYTGWRKYVFAPHAETIFEEQCLRDIAEFCESLTTKRMSVYHSPSE